MTERSIIHAPGIGNERAYAIVQMGRGSDGIARVAYGTYLCTVIHQGEPLGLDFVQMGIVVQSPFRSKHNNKLTTFTILGREEHDAYGSRVYPRASTRKHIDALVHDRCPPPFVPEGLMVITIAIGPYNV